MTTSTLSYTAQFALLEPWHRLIFTSVKKDLRTEHLKHDKAFFHAHFGSKVLVRLTVDDLLAVYPPVIAKGNEKLAEFIANRWVLKHLDIYTFFEKELKTIHTHIESITEIDPVKAEALIEASCQRFGATDSYIFCIFNSVCFLPENLEQIKERALHEIRAAVTSSAT